MMFMSRSWSWKSLFAAGIVAATFVVPCAGENLLVNPGFAGIDGWALGPNTTVDQFPAGGGVDLNVSESSGPIISQCVSTPGFTPENVLSLTLTLTLLEGNSGRSDSFLRTYVSSDCTGPLIADALSERLFFDTMTPGQPAALTTTLVPPPQTGSVLVGQFAAGTESGVTVNVRDPVLEATGYPDDTGAPDLAPFFSGGLGELFRFRFGDRAMALIAIPNHGDTESSGEWEVTLTAPSGFRLVCGDPSFDCSGNGTSVLVIRGTEPISHVTVNPFDFFSIPVFVEAVGEVATGEGAPHSFEVSITGGGDATPGNNASSTPVVVDPPRMASELSPDPPVSTSGRQR